MSLQQLGVPIRAVCVWAAAYGQEEGEDRIYAVSSGKPCVLFVIDPHSGRCLDRCPLEGASHSWGVVAAKTGVYITGDGYLYRYTAARGLERLGTIIEGETYTWRAAADRDGNVYGGCYPGGKVFRYDPETGRFHDYGQVVEGEQYVRCMKAYDGKLYIGIGTQKPYVIEMDTATGAKKQIPLPPETSQEQMVYDLDVVYPKLFVRLTPSNDMYVYDMEQKAWSERIEDANGLAVSSESAEGKVYFAKEGYLYAYVTASGALECTNVALTEAIVDFGWIDCGDSGRPGKSLLWVNRDGSVSLYHPGTGHFEIRDVELLGQPVTLHSLAQDPDGHVHVGGYFAGGLAKYDTEADELLPSRTFGQIENMISYQGMLYAGVYPKANIFRYDPSLPWEPGSNPRMLFSLRKHRQDRPFAFADAGDKLAIGTVADYGNLNGALTLYDPVQDSFETYKGVVHEQSIISLAAKDGIVYAGSSVWGGLGIQPTQQEAKLVMWDAKDAKKLWEGVPVPGEKKLTALAMTDDGMLWGLAGGLLFQFDPAAKAVMKTIRLFDLDWSGMQSYWRGGRLEVHPDGYLVGSTLKRLFRFDLKTEKVDELDTDAELFANDRDWNLYFVRDTSLYKYSQD